MDGRNPHAVLGVPVCASPEEIKRAFRARALDAHPDRGGCREHFEALVAAAETLLGPHRTVRRNAPVRPNPFARTTTQSDATTWSVYDSPRPPVRPRTQHQPRQTFAAILRDELARAA